MKILQGEKYTLLPNATDYRNPFRNRTGVIPCLILSSELCVCVCLMHEFHYLHFIGRVPYDYNDKRQACPLGKKGKRSVLQSCRMQVITPLEAPLISLPLTGGTS